MVRCDFGFQCRGSGGTDKWFLLLDRSADQYDRLLGGRLIVDESDGTLSRLCFSSMFLIYWCVTHPHS